MKSKLLVLSLLLIVIFSKPIFAQFSMYGSASYGFNRNPLGNYQQLSDQLKQTYLEMNYQKQFQQSSLGFSYVSSLVLFNEFGDRSFYEHNFYTRYKIKFTKNDASPKRAENLEESKDSSEGEAADSTDENTSEENSVETANADASDENSSDEEEAIDDSTGKYLDFMIKAGARHDKEIFKEFDNVGAEFTAAYKFLLFDGLSLRLANSTGYRNYTNIAELSNVTDQFIVQLANKFNGSHSYGLRLSAATKFYTSTLYDTARYEQKKTTIKKPGKGKGGAAVEVPSGKQILIQPQANGTVQYAGGLFFIKSWESGSFETDFLYSFSPKISARYLAQHINTSALTEDLYNDFFSYEGPSVNIKFNCPLFFKIQFYSELLMAKKNFGAPALDLNGDETAAHRKDIHSSLEMSFTRPLNLTGGLNIDLVFGLGLLRNESNDDYNDFSAYNLSGGIGIGL